MSHETRQSLENDGHRTVMWRDAEAVLLQARFGRTVTSSWMVLAVAGMDSLRPGTVLDAAIREAREEVGLHITPASLRHFT
ncbi:NUDIX domain-containing protein [Streptomyces sp. NPDC048527]|uniref:NUDIX domain-containing protein n=1 Tax=Streptomyces sp. NPDC048527 TaxID=3365568 RepID=UPI00371A4061